MWNWRRCIRWPLLAINNIPAGDDVPPASEGSNDSHDDDGSQLPQQGPVTPPATPVPAPPRPPDTGRVIVVTYTSRPGPGRDTAMPVPRQHQVVHGAAPTVRPSAIIPNWATPFLDMTFTAPGARKCWLCLVNRVLPDPVPADDIDKFAIYEDPDHPWQVLRRSFPVQACLFDTAGFDPSVPVSKRAPYPVRLKAMWADFAATVPRLTSGSLPDCAHETCQPASSDVPATILAVMPGSGERSK